MTEVPLQLKAHIEHFHNGRDLHILEMVASSMDMVSRLGRSSLNT